MRVCNGLDALSPGTALERWVRGCLGRDAVVTVEPWLDIVIEFSVECVNQHLVTLTTPYNNHPLLRWLEQRHHLFALNSALAAVYLSMCVCDSDFVSFVPHRWLEGRWNGLSMQIVEHMRYQGCAKRIICAIFIDYSKRSF